MCVCVCVCVLVDDKRCQFNMDELETHAGLPHEINRSCLYDDVIDLYTKSTATIIQEFPFRVTFTGEKAVDTGGVCRDMFSAFWDDAYLKSFDGGIVLTPAMHPGVSMNVFPILGTIISHGFLSCGFLPIRIAFPVLAAIVYGPTVSIPTDMLLKSFEDFLTSYESGIVKLAVFLEKENKSFSSNLLSKLIEILSRMGCCRIPTRDNFKVLLTEVAQFNFTTKCMGALYAMHSGIPVTHRSFWNKLSIEDFFRLYQGLIATPERILSILKHPECNSAAQERVFDYLVTFIGDIKQEELLGFTRFVTGCSVLVARELTVTFNGASGLGRQPFAQTCPCNLELPTSYSSYQEFAREFLGILRSDSSLTWAMDAI